jgi:type IV pilus assembly protein PilM
MFQGLGQIFKKIAPTIGMDLGFASIKTVELKGKIHNLQLISAHSEESPPDSIVDGEIINKELVARRLNKIVQKFAWQGKQVITAVGGRKAVIRHLKMPVMPDAELKNAVQYELESYLPFGNREVVVDYVNLGIIEGEKEKQCLILIGAIPKETALAYYEVFLAADLELVAIDIVPLALQRALTSKALEKEIAIADIGAESTSFIILSDGKVSLTRSISTGSTILSQDLFMFTEQVAATRERLSPSIIDNAPKDIELVRELHRSFDFWRTQSQNKGISKLIITGGIGNLEGMDLFLSKQLGLPVKIGQPLAGLLKKDQLLGPEYAIAAGLALRGVTK